MYIITLEDKRGEYAGYWTGTAFRYGLFKRPPYDAKRYRTDDGIAALNYCKTIPFGDYKIDLTPV